MKKCILKARKEAGDFVTQEGAEKGYRYPWARIFGSI
jgi:hypothetical protein